MGLEKQGSKPTGFTGKVIGRLMNKLQTSLYINYFENNLPKEGSKILDVGCGGGEFLKFLYGSDKSYLLYGLDHSPVMIELSAKINKNAIAQKRLELIQGESANITLENSCIDLVTAFETVQFWSDINQSFSEINRLLKAGGQFLIINRYPSVGSKWWKMAKIKSDKEYINKLENSGFVQIETDLEYKKGWIIVSASKS